MSARAGANGRLIPVLLLCFVTLPASVQLAAQTEPIRVSLNEIRSALTAEVTHDSDQRLTALMNDAVISELESLGFIVSSGPAEPPELQLDVSYLVGGVRLTLVMAVTDPGAGSLVAGGTYLGTVDLALVNTVRGAVAEIAQQIRAAVAIEDEHPQPPVVLLRLVLRSPDEGAQVYLGDDVQLGVIEDGRLEAPFTPLALGSELLVRKQLEGYYSETESIPITDQYMDVELSALRQRIDWEISLSWMPQRWAGAAAGLRRYLAPERFYAQSTNQLSSRYRFAAGSRASAVLDTRLTLGGYVIAIPERRFRLGLSGGAGVTLSLLGGEENAYLFADPYLNVFSLAAKWQFDGFAPFVQSDLVYYGSAGTGYMVRGTHGYLSLGVLLPWRL